MTNGDDYAGQPDTSSVQTDTSVQPAQATPADSSSTELPAVTVTGSDKKVADPDKDDGDPVLTELLRHYHQDNKREEEARSYYDNMRKQIAEVDQRIKAAPLPSVPEHMQIPPPPDQQQLLQQQRGGVGTILAQGLILAGIASTIFGRRHNPWANAAMMSGMGSFIDGFTKAQHETATEQLQNWNHSVEYAVKMNQEADRTYNETLSNRRLDLTQQMDVIKAIAAQRQDVEMYKAANSKDLNQIIRVVEQHDRANGFMSRAQIDVNSRAANLWLKGQVGNSWSMYVIEKSGGTLDPTKDEASFRKARELYPPVEWMESHTKGGAAKKEAQVSFDSLAKEVTRVLGKDKAPGWTQTLENNDPFERGNVIDKEETTGGLFGIDAPILGMGKTTEKVKTWVADPKGTKYTFGESDEDKVKNAAPSGVIDSLVKQYDKLRGSTGQGGQAAKDNYPVLTTKAEASRYPVGTLFRDGQGNLRKVITQNPLQVSKPLSEEQATTQ